MSGKPARTRIDLYGVEVYLATNRRQFGTLRRKLPFLDPAPDYAGSTDFAVFKPKGQGLTSGHLVFWVDVENHDSTRELVDTLAHEASHGAGRILGWIGHKVDETDEPSAYLVGWLTGWLWENIA